MSTNGSFRPIQNHPLRIPLILCLFFLLFSSPGWSTEPALWKGWRGPNQDFTIENGGLFPPGETFSARVVWRQPLGQGYSPVSVDERMAVTMFSDGTSDVVIAFDANDGHELWRHKIGPKHPGRYGSMDGPISAPLIHNGRVIAVSPYGILLALDAQTGKQLWNINLKESYGTILPYYGLGTSPQAYGDRVIVELGGSEGKAISLIDPATGAPVWASVTDTIAYQSPSVINIDGKDQIIGVGNRFLTGLDPTTGKILWQHAHEGRNSASGTEGGNLVFTGPNRFLWKDSGGSASLLKLGFGDHGYSVTELWNTRNIRGTYLVPVYHNGLIFGHNGRILICIDAETGERVWRSREPGDGLPILVDGHLVIATKEGKLSVAPASGDGYEEKVSLQVFDNLVWAPPAFANGKLYIRSMSEIACVEIVAQTQIAESTEAVPGIIPGSNFSEFLDRVKQSDDKAALIDAFISKQDSFPVIEGQNLVHFIYRGDGKDVALTGDLIGWRYDQPMHHVDGTDLYYYSMRLEPDARVTYRFTKDLQKSVPDTLNPRVFRSRWFGRANWFHMPTWQPPVHLENHNLAARGSIDTLDFKTQFRDDSLSIPVYLPAGYETSSARYPVVYFHEGDLAQSKGQLQQSLDYLLGRTVEPVIVVFVPRILKGGYAQYLGAQGDKYLTAFVDELIPAVDQKYRTRATREMRANMGCGFLGGFLSYIATIKKPEAVGKLAVQSMWWDSREDENVRNILPSPSENPLDIYIAWGKYDLYSPLEGAADIKKSTRRGAQLLTEAGYKYEGGEFNGGHGWHSWKTRADKMFETLFPLQK